MFAFWLTCGYFNVFSNIVNKKMTKKSTFFAHLLPSETLAADSQMTTSFFMLRPAKGREMNHSQMTTSFFMLQSWMVDIRFWVLDSRCSHFASPVGDGLRHCVLYSPSVPQAVGFLFSTNIFGNR